MIGVVLLTSSTCPAEEILFGKAGLAGISQFSSEFDRLGKTSDPSVPFLGLPLGNYYLEGNFQLDLKKTSPIDIGKEKENLFSVQFSIRW